MTESARRVALVNDASGYVGPALARELARRGHDLVLGSPAEGLVEELTALGAAVEAVDGARNLARPESAPALVAAALGRFGRLDAAAAFSGQIIPGNFMDSSVGGPAPAGRGMHRGAVPLPQGRGRADDRAGWRTDRDDHQCGGRPTDPRCGAVLVGARRRHDDGQEPGAGGRVQGRAGQRARHELHGLPRVPRCHRRRAIPRSARWSSPRCPCDASARWRSSRRSPWPSWTAPAASPPGSSSPTPAAGSDPAIIHRSHRSAP